jgi:hypothetical protein
MAFAVGAGSGVTDSEGLINISSNPFRNYFFFVHRLGWRWPTWETSTPMA